MRRSQMILQSHDCSDLEHKSRLLHVGGSHLFQDEKCSICSINLKNYVCVYVLCVRRSFLVGPQHHCPWTSCLSSTLRQT